VEGRPGDTGWATFSDSGGGEGEAWQPNFASSPEATMLDCELLDSPSPSQPPVPCPGPPDIADTNANPAPVPSDTLKEGEEGSEPQAGEASLQDNFSFLAARGLITGHDSDVKGCDNAEVLPVAPEAVVAKEPASSPEELGAAECPASIAVGGAVTAPVPHHEAEEGVSEAKE